MDTHPSAFGSSTPDTEVDAIEKVTDEPNSRLMCPCHASGSKVLRSPYAHARIKHIAPVKPWGCLAYGPSSPAAICATLNWHPRSIGSITPHRILLSHGCGSDKVLFHGHAVAAVAAISSDTPKPRWISSRWPMSHYPMCIDAVGRHAP